MSVCESCAHTVQDSIAQQGGIAHYRCSVSPKPFPHPCALPFLFSPSEAGALARECRRSVRLNVYCIWISVVILVICQGDPQRLIIMHCTKALFSEYKKKCLA